MLAIALSGIVGFAGLGTEVAALVLHDALDARRRSVGGRERSGRARRRDRFRLVGFKRSTPAYRPRDFGDVQFQQRRQQHNCGGCYHAPLTTTGLDSFEMQLRA